MTALFLVACGGVLTSADAGPGGDAGSAAWDGALRTGCVVTISDLGNCNGQPERPVTCDGPVPPEPGSPSMYCCP